MEPKKVVFIVGTLSTGGIERSVADWAIHLKKTRTWEPAIICVLERSGVFIKPLEEQGIEIYECRIAQLGFSWSLKKLLNKINPDVVHSQVASSMPWQMIGIKLAGVKKVIFTQQNDYQGWNAFIPRVRLRLYFLLFFPLIDHYTCVSSKVRENLSKMTGISLQKFKVIPNGVNTDKFQKRPDERRVKRSELGIDSSVFLVGMVARFSPQKGHEYLIEGVKELSSVTSGFKVILIGAGELESEVKKKIKEYSLDNYFIFYGRASQVDKVLQALDCFIMTSLWEGMPLALLEAMACSIPAIGTDVAGIHDVLEHQKNGLLIAAKDPGAIAAALKTYMDDPELATQLAGNALSTVKKKFSVLSNIESYTRLYEQ